MPNFKTNLHVNKQMEQFNIAYVHAIASYCGWKLSGFSIDDDGLDVAIHGEYDINNRTHRARIEIQLKSTWNLEFDDEHVIYKLRAKNYNDLCGDNFSIPRYLFVMDLDVEQKNWLVDKDDSILLTKKCYWYSLQDLEKTTNKYSRKVKIPISQVLNKDSLNKLMRASAEGEEL